MLEKKLEDMDSQEVFDRFIATGDYEDLNNPEVQRLLIKHGYVDVLTDMIYVITDKQVIKDIFSSNLFENKNITFKQGKIEGIKFVEIENGKKHLLEPMLVEVIEFVEKESKEKFLLDRRSDLGIRGKRCNKGK